MREGVEVGKGVFLPITDLTGGVACERRIGTGRNACVPVEVRLSLLTRLK